MAKKTRKSRKKAFRASLNISSASLRRSSHKKRSKCLARERIPASEEEKKSQPRRDNEYIKQIWMINNKNTILICFYVHDAINSEVLFEMPNGGVCEKIQFKFLWKPVLCQSRAWKLHSDLYETMKVHYYCWNPYTNTGFLIFSLKRQRSIRRDFDSTLKWLFITKFEI